MEKQKGVVEETEGGGAHQPDDTTDVAPETSGAAAAPAPPAPSATPAQSAPPAPSEPTAPSQTPAPSASSASEASTSTPQGKVMSGTLVHGGRFIQYDIFGNVFEVTSKYGPPIEAVGRGAYGVVCSVTNSETGERVAIKKIARAFERQVVARCALREIKILRHMRHSNIIAIKDVIPPPTREIFNDVYIAFELMRFDLQDILRLGMNLTEQHYQCLLYQILRGLKYIHSANVLHRDLKPSNLLINPNWTLKICDFGLARVASRTGMTAGVVTTWYRAPELLLESTDYGEAIDVWSVGCIFMEIMIKKVLFPGASNVAQLGMIMELIGTPNEADLGFASQIARSYIDQLPHYAPRSFTETFPGVSPEAIDLAKRMLTFDPRERITVEEALAHPNVKPLHDVYPEPVCETPLSFDFEQRALSEERVKFMIWLEAMATNPNYRI